MYGWPRRDVHTCCCIIVSHRRNSEVEGLKDKTQETQEKAYWLLPTALSKVEYRECRKIDFTVTKRSQVKELAG